MESINSAIKMLFNNCFMVVVDLKDAYYHVPIHADFQRYLRGQHVRILSDNRVAVAYINRQGGTRSETLMQITDRLFQVAELNFLSLTALHIKGKENVAADFLSRNVLKQGEWSLNEDIFNLVVRRWGQPVVDLFATRNNRKGESPGGRRVSHKMGFSTGLCFPTTEPDTSSGEENQGGSSESHPYRPLLAQKNLVCLAQDNVCSGPLGTARDPGLAFSGTDLPSTSGGAPFDGMEFERSLLVGKGFSPNLVETLLKSRKQITTRIYSRTWRKFLSCSKFNVQDGVPVQQILEFLQKGFELKLSPSTLRPKEVSDFNVTKQFYNQLRKFQFLDICRTILKLRSWSPFEKSFTVVVLTKGMKMQNALVKWIKICQSYQIQYTSSLEKLHSSRTLSLARKTNVRNINSLSVDWLTGQLVWASSADKTISVGLTDGRGYVHIIEKGIVPDQLVVFPPERYMYWVNYGLKGNTTLQTAGMDGSDWHVILFIPMEQPTGLTIDYITSRLYWISEYKESIETIKTDGSGRFTFPNVLHKDQNVLGLSIFEGWFFMADESHLFSLLRNNPKERRLLMNTSNISAFTVLHELQQPNGGCSCPQSLYSECQ
ncbi:unnamed protein product [Ranitomeya imitator]|uniref:Reverse transcriptase domain-containing protein n=1 Tax=Ranitomeya imitator TaxID=111125 RepID=A0ABN9M3J1_9NEOB|nr:unnamed protein product [Ranitomeya imitator]